VVGIIRSTAWCGRLGPTAKTAQWNKRVGAWHLPSSLSLCSGPARWRVCQSQGRRNGGGEHRWGKASPSGKVVGSGTHQKGGGSTVRRQWQHREVVFRHWRGFRSSVAADARSYIIGERKSKLGARQIGPKVHGEVAH
jgi:hypothetical protein